MAEPDLVTLAARAKEIARDLGQFRDEVKAARDMALGSEDGSDPGSDDATEAFDSILDVELDGAHLPLLYTQEKLAAIEGYRVFRRAGVVE